MGQQHHVLMLSTAGRSILPGTIAALTDAKNLAETLDGEFLLRRIDETEPHRLPSLAKKVAAPLQDLAFLPQDLILAPQPLQLSRQVLLPFGRRRLDLVLEALVEPARRSVERPTPRQSSWRSPFASDHHSPQPTERLRLQIPFPNRRCGLPHEMLLFPSEELSTFPRQVQESVFSSLKTERIGKKVYRSRDAARADVFDYIERFYNPVRRHSTIGYLSPLEFERKVGLA